jgi:hypothetical protein
VVGNLVVDIGFVEGRVAFACLIKAWLVALLLGGFDVDLARR